MAEMQDMADMHAGTRATEDQIVRTPLTPRHAAARNAQTQRPDDHLGPIEQVRALPRRVLLRHIIDWIFLAVVIVIAGAIANGSVRSPADRLFGAFQNTTNGLSRLSDQERLSLDYEEYELFPVRKQIIPVWLAALLGFVVSAAAVAIAQIWVRSWHDLYNGIFGIIQTLILSTVFQVIVKILIGGTRPNFLSVCRPDLSRAPPQGYGGAFYNRDVCTGDETEINDGLQSFPSGHSSAAFASFVFLFFYLNGKFKTWSLRRADVYKVFLTCVPLLFAVLLALSRTLDYTHHWYDILGGSLNGVFWGFVSYRSQYAAIWNYRTNHIPTSYESDPIVPGIKARTADSIRSHWNPADVEAGYVH